MKIGAGNVAMESSHRKYTYAHSMTRSIGQSADDSGRFSSFMTSGTYNRDLIADRQFSQLNSGLSHMKSFKEMADQIKSQSEADIDQLSDIDSFRRLKDNLLMWLLDLLCGRKTGTQETRGSASDLYSISQSEYMSTKAQSSSQNTFWKKLETSDYFTTEHESTTFAATGTVCTTDGREISFDVELGMSRDFMQEVNIAPQTQSIMTDPLVINFDTPVTELSDQKFYFDIDTDGKNEKISRTGAGSGFLALDKNGDGKVNDGSELFGTKSGNGFKDLAAFDADHNGWIDENDDIYDRLRIWTNDENGEERLIDLKTADVGAIYLGSADTEYSLKNMENTTHGMIRRTGIFLHESTGQAGTLNHVDLVTQ